MKLLIKDNFFDNPNKIRELALSMEYVCSEDLIVDPGWRGHRTDDWDNEISDNILNIVSDYYNISGQRILTYYHISHQGTRKTLEDFDNRKYHIDPDRSYAGVVYLTPNPPPKTGTSILDGSKNEIINVENVYNRLISYPSNHIHAPSDVFGDDKETGRLTLTYFIEPNWSYWSSNTEVPIAS